MQEGRGKRVLSGSDVVDRGEVVAMVYGGNIYRSHGNERLHKAMVHATLGWLLLGSHQPPPVTRRHSQEAAGLMDHGSFLRLLRSQL